MLNKFIFACESFRDSIKELVQRELSSSVSSNNWWLVLKQAIQLETIWFSMQLSLDKSSVEELLLEKARVEELNKDVEEALRLGPTY